MKRIVLAVLVLCACKNESSRATPAPSASASASASAPAGPPKPVSYEGSYTATAGELYVPDASEYKGFKFRGEDAGAVGEGQGSITFTVDPDGGALSGKLEGPLGPGTISGVAQNGELTFHLSPNDRGDMAFNGTGTGSLDGGAASGEIHASSWHANVLRDATFTAKAKPQ